MDPLLGCSSSSLSAFNEKGFVNASKLIQGSSSILVAPEEVGVSDEKTVLKISSLYVGSF